MSYSSRHQSSRRTHADTSGFSRATYDGYEDYPHRLPSIREHGYDSHVGSGNREPRNRTVTSHKITVTSYSVNNGGESTASYHDSAMHTAYNGHRSPLGYLDAQRAASYSRTDRSSFLSDTVNDPRYLSAGGYSDTPRRPRDESRMPEASSHRSRVESKDSDRSRRGSFRTGVSRDDRHDQSARQNVKPSRPEESRPTYTDAHSSKSKTHSNHKHATNDHHSQSKPRSGSSRRQEKPDSSRSESRREEIPRSTGDDRTHGERERRHHAEASPTKATEKLPDHYATLQVEPLATHEQIKSAAKRRRVEVHPDKLKTPEMSDSESANIDAAAAKVGEAADVLTNPTLRQEYDRSLYAANLA